MGKITTVTTSTTTLTTDEGIELELPDAPYDDYAAYAIQPDGTIRVAYLLLDLDPVNPLVEYDMGEYVEFDDNRTWGSDAFERLKGLTREHGKRVRLVHNFGDRRVGTPYVDRDQVDTAVGAYVIPDDVPAESRDDYANAVWGEVAAWADGDVYGLATMTFAADGTGLTDPEAGPDWCFGYYGHDHAVSLRDDFIATGNR